VIIAPPAAYRGQDGRRERHGDNRDDERGEQAAHHHDVARDGGDVAGGEVAAARYAISRSRRSSSASAERMCSRSSASTVCPMTVSSAHGRASTLLSATFGGLAVGVLGLLIQWIAAPNLFGAFGFPPGIVYLVAAGGIVWLDRRAAWSPIAAIGLALWIVIGGVAGGNLTRNLASPEPGVVVGNVVMSIGLVAAAVAGAFAITANRRSGRTPLPRPLAAENPRRLAVIVTLAGLLAAAIGDAAPEGLNWDGPGPVLFTLLAILTAVVPGRSVPLLSVLLSLAFLVTAFMVPESLARLSNPADVLPFAGTVTQVIGLAVAVVAAVATTLPTGRSRQEITTA
jgi:hypothetical protein